MASTRATAALCALVLTLAAAPSTQEQQYETAFLSIPSAGGARETSQFINSRMHYAGTPGDYRLAIYVRDKMRQLGLQAKLETFRTIVYTPRVLALQLLNSPVVTFNLHERPIPSDPDGSRPDAGIPFNAGSGNGDVRAAAVYVSRGLENDYDALARVGVNVRGKIALVRYGAEFRGNLAKRAQDHGAAGVIFYSDPLDDGFARGAVFPKGPFRPAGAVQRGTVALDDGQLQIPTLPVTSITAQKLLANMTGKPGPAQWGGALPVHYVLGQTKSLVHLQVEMNAKPTTLWNSVGQITGADPQQTVVIGAHRDAWVYGVSDDGSGIATLLEVARGYGELHKHGWTPHRTIRIIGFDAEELGELGSRAYVATHMAELKRGCVAYVNVDEAASGPHLDAGGAAALIPDATSAVKAIDGVSLKRIGTPGGGSDFEGFIYGAGVPTLNIGYSGPLGVYHSSFDDYMYMSRIADPGYAHHRAIARTVGVMAMRLADSPAIQYSFESYDSVLSGGLKALVQQAKQAKVPLQTLSLQVAIQRFTAAAATFDGDPNPNKDARALQAVQGLNALAYSSSGYTSVAFPKLSAAIASSDRQAVDDAISQTATSLNAVTDLLK